MGVKARQENFFSDIASCERMGRYGAVCKLQTYAVAVDKDGKKFKAQGGDRVMYTTHHPCWDAKNRDGLPSEMPFEYSGIAHLFAYTQPAEMPKPVPMPRRVQEQLVQPKQHRSPS